MQFMLNIDCDNAAFEDDAAAEVARILEGLAAHLRGMSQGYPEGHLRDANGNAVGYWVLAS